uniref:Low density lipoprotein receptor-related protein 11 n=1 Tax=Cynoglossus semilaevis TaxID=244447 RepID=A0A3P8UYG0_CYNSE
KVFESFIKCIGHSVCFFVFRQQLRGGEDATVDSCLGDYDAVGERIIRARDSIELGATFLLAPEPLYSWRDCLHACCRESHCTLAVVQEDVKRSGDRISCYLFNCTYRGKNVCLFAAQEGFTSYSRAANSTQGLATKIWSAADEPPRSDAGQDVVIQLPTDWAVLDGRDSVDDHGINRYEWTLVKGDTAISMKHFQYTEIIQFLSQVSCSIFIPFLYPKGTSDLEECLRPFH